MRGYQIDSKLFARSRWVLVVTELVVSGTQCITFPSLDEVVLVNLDEMTVSEFHD